MTITRWAPRMVGLILILALTACAPLPAGVQAPAATAAPAQVPTQAPTLVPTPAPTPTPAVPDPKTDPMAALLYVGQPGLSKSAGARLPHDAEHVAGRRCPRRSAGDEAELLRDVRMTITGDGAMEVTDPGAAKSKMRMNMNLSMAGQQMDMELVMIDQTAWIRAGPDGDWQKVEGEQAMSAIPGRHGP